MSLDFWTDERAELLKVRYKDGDSYTKIATLIGHGCSRSSVAGKVKRLGLSRSAEINHRNNARPKVKDPAAQPKPLRAPAVKLVNNGLAAVNAARKPPVLQGFGAKPGEMEGTADLVDLDGHSCRYPVGDPMTPEFKFCGRHKPDLDKPYCVDHAKIAYRPAAERTEAQKAGDAEKRLKAMYRRLARAA